MYFPDNMNFQYFFFDTYPGLFLQMIPIALLAGAVYVLVRTRREPRLSAGQVVLGSLFVGYLAALVGLTLFEKFVGGAYYRLFYHMPSGTNYRWFTFEYYLVPDSFHRLSAENLANILLYLPFGILYPLFDRRASWKKTLCAGLLTCLAIELIQPIFGRSFDINDIILNALGLAVSTALFFALKSALGQKR